MIGLATVTSVVSAAMAPVTAKAATFQLTSGVTSVFLDLPTLQSAAGLNLTGATDTVPPVSSSFLVGFPFTSATELYLQF